MPAAQHTRRYLKHHRVPKPERHYAQPLWHEPRVLHGQENAREFAAQLERGDARGQIDGFVFDIAAHELARVRNETMDKRKKGTRRTTNVANQLSLACPDRVDIHAHFHLRLDCESWEGAQSLDFTVS